MRQFERDQLQEEQRRLRNVELDQARLTHANSSSAWPASDEKWIHQFLTALFERS